MPIFGVRNTQYCSATMSKGAVVSVCDTKAAASNTETIEWRIHSWSMLPTSLVVIGETEQGWFCSETMSAAGHQWRLRVARGGSCSQDATEEQVQKSKKSASLELIYEGDSAAVRAHYGITIVNQLPDNDDLTLSWTRVGLDPVTFGKVDVSNPGMKWYEEAKKSHGFSLGRDSSLERFILEDDSNGWKINDRVIIRATITTFSKLESATITPAMIPPNTATSDFKSMFDSGYASDIMLHVSGREFKAHRNILGSRSPYFKALFASSMRDSNSRDLKITDTEPDVFEQLLSWIYAGEVDNDALQVEHMLEHLLMSANLYECIGLKQLCESKLCEHFTAENVAPRLVLSEQVDAGILKNKCIEFIKQNIKVVRHTEGWKGVEKNNTLLIEIVAFIAGDTPISATVGKKRTADEAGL